jgi:pyruvate/2-oxoglutarate dehydrogenase complex dihydrolipoamide dehydrogenase (E3) component
VVEHGPFGGTCLDRGCIPSKMLIHSANLEAVHVAHNIFNLENMSSVDYHAMPHASSPCRRSPALI